MSLYSDLEEMRAEITRLQDENDQLREKVDSWKAQSKIFAGAADRQKAHEVRQDAEIRRLLSENKVFKDELQHLLEECSALRAENLCDACGGLGIALSGPCMCLGTGKMSEAAKYLRERLLTAQEEAREEGARQERDRIRNLGPFHTGPAAHPGDQERNDLYNFAHEQGMLLGAKKEREKVLEYLRREGCYDTAADIKAGVHVG